MSEQRVDDSAKTLGGVDAEDAGSMSQFCDEHGAGAKALDLSEANSARLKSCPDTKPGSVEVGFAVGFAESSLAQRGTTEAAPMSLAAVRQELKGVKGKKYWRSLDELADTAEFQAAV